jgi:hypothetical protein
MSDQSKITKSERGLLRRLAGDAWNAELNGALKKLSGDFAKWSGGGMNAFELSDKIHEFHNGISRELYGRYTNLNPEFLVSRAVALGILDRKALGEPVLEKLSYSIEPFLKMQEE